MAEKKRQRKAIATDADAHREWYLRLGPADHRRMRGGLVAEIAGANLDAKEVGEIVFATEADGVVVGAELVDVELSEAAAVAGAVAWAADLASPGHNRPPPTPAQLRDYQRHLAALERAILEGRDDDIRRATRALFPLVRERQLVVAEIAGACANVRGLAGKDREARLRREAGRLRSGRYGGVHAGTSPSGAKYPGETAEDTGGLGRINHRYRDLKLEVIVDALTERGNAAPAGVAATLAWHAGTEERLPRESFRGFTERVRALFKTAAGRSARPDRVSSKRTN